MKRTIVATGFLALFLFSAARAADVVWNQKGAAWEDPANWSGGKVPGPGDVAVFPDVAKPIANQPTVAGTVRVAGIRLGVAPITVVAVPSPWAQNACWIIGGPGTIAVGKRGIVVPKGISIIHPALELTADQPWDIGSPWTSVEAEMMIIPDGDQADDAALVTFGTISGPGGITKLGRGKVHVIANASPTFTGGVHVSKGTLAWVLSGLAQNFEGHFGTGTIVLDGGFFAFTANHSPNVGSISLLNTIQVMGGGAAIQCGTALTDDGYLDGDPKTTPRCRFSGNFDLRGLLTYGRQGNGKVFPEIEGPITIYQESPATPGIMSTAWCEDGKMVLSGPITDGPGHAGNPLILRSNTYGITVANPDNTYAGPTISTYTGNEEGDAERYAIVFVAPQAKLGKGDLLIEPGGQVRLSSPTNLADTAQVTIHSMSAVLGALTVGYNGVPKITADSSGVLAIDVSDFDAITDLSTLGDGRMRLGARDVGVFTGDTLAPGKDNLYRLGGGSNGGMNWLWVDTLASYPRQKTPYSLGTATLRIKHGVLVGSAGVEVGANARLGNGAVVLEGPNTFTGPLTVQGPDEAHEGQGWAGSVLEGLEQKQPGQSPFGSPTGSVHVLDSVFRLDGTIGGQPVTKGELTFVGGSTIDLNSGKNSPVSLTVAKLTREGNAVLIVNPMHQQLGDQEKLLVSDWKQDVDVLPPYLLAGHDKDLSFAHYDASGGKGICPAPATSHDLLTSKDTDIVETDKVSLAGGVYRASALKATDDIDGAGTIKVASGGLLLAGHIQPDVDFGDAEGIVCAAVIHGSRDPCVLLGKVSGSKGITVSTMTLHYFHDGIGLVNTKNNFHGPVTVDNCVLVAVLDKRNPDGTFTAGSLGDLHNDIYLNGAMLAMATDTNHVGDCLAPTRTIHIGPAGAVFVPPNYMKSVKDYSQPRWYTIYSKITGPGYISTNNNAPPRIIIANPDNDYSGGTWVCPQSNMIWQVTESGKLGTGPVLVATECCLILHGDGNIDRNSRLTVSADGLAVFNSAHPLIGSLDGSGYIDLGQRSAPATGRTPATVATDTTLTVGSDNTDSTFWGTIRQVGAVSDDGIGALSKTGTGTFTLHGAQTYTGPTTVEQGTLILKGSVAGDVMVKKGAAFIQQGTVGGKVTVEQGALFKDQRKK